MPTYNVHIYRELRLYYPGIQADSPEEAARIAEELSTDEAENIHDCDGQTFAAVVDRANQPHDDGKDILFEDGRLRLAAHPLLAACRMVVDRWEHGDLAEAARTCQAAITVAESAGSRSESSTPGLLASLEAVLPYAENESRSLYTCWKRDDDDAARQTADTCERAIEQARTAIATAKAAGVRPEADATASKPYSVLLLYPDYLSEQYGTETYYAFVQAADPLNAVTAAQLQAVAAQDVEIDDPADFAPLLVTLGHNDDQPIVITYSF